ncbi:hypothetical protein [Haliscomenobacter sp.]|uniref:hypothetical protein n=1 Tax=Haliscomenobacter sp. TaxID=2717303 RepID=UPI0035934712
MIFLQNITGTCCTRNVHNPIGIAVGESQSGIAQVVFETVLLAPGDGIGGINIGVVVAAFGVVHAFHPFGTRARLAVFNAAWEIVLDVLYGSSCFGGFAQFVASSVVEELDGVASAERDQLGEDKDFLGVLG